jgi:hypothetical protein
MENFIEPAFKLVRSRVLHPMNAVTALFALTLPSIVKATEGAGAVIIGGMSSHICDPASQELANRVATCVSRGPGSFGPIFPPTPEEIENHSVQVDVWEKCMKKAASHLEGNTQMLSEVADIHYALAQVSERKEQFDESANRYSTSFFYSFFTPQEKIHNPSALSQKRTHMDIQEHVVRLKGLLFGTEEEKEKAKIGLDFSKEGEEFDYKRPSDLLSLIYLSYSAGDCFQSRELIRLTEVLIKRGVIKLEGRVAFSETPIKEIGFFQNNKGFLFTPCSGKSLRGECEMAEKRAFHELKLLVAHSSLSEPIRNV